MRLSLPIAPRQGKASLHGLFVRAETSRETPQVGGGDIDLPRTEGDDLLIAGDPRGMAADAVLLGPILPQRAVSIGGAGCLGGRADASAGAMASLMAVRLCWRKRSSASSKFLRTWNRSTTRG